MAKKQKEKPSPSLLDFNEENLLDNLTEPAEEEFEEEQELEEEEEVIVKPLKKGGKTTPTPKSKKNEPEPEPDPALEEEEEEEEEEGLPDATGKDQGDAKENEEDVSGLFYEKVQTITGVEVETDYGDIDPLSPQGVALREKSLIDKTINDFVDKLEQEYPAVHEALMYAHSGGDIADLFKTEKDYSKVTIGDDDEDHAKHVLTEYYEAKGITNEARVKRMIAADAESDEGLVKIAQAALAEMVEEQNAQKQQALVTQQKQAEAQRQNDQKFLGSISELLKGGKLDSFKVPSQDIPAFSQFVRQRVQRDGNGGYMIVTPVDPAQLEKQLQTEYFRFKNGDLNKLIQIKATTQNAEKLRLKISQKENTPKSTSAGGKTSGSLKDFEK